MKRHFLIFILYTLVAVSYGQDSSYFRQHVIRVENQDSLSNDIFKVISSYKLILIGEMHGTNEPAQFVIGLANLLAKNNDTVQVGLEIPSDKMKRYLTNPVDSNVYMSDFFALKSMDARGCFAWADIISKLKNCSKIKIFFYDINTDDSSHYNDRDSLMYIKIKKRIESHPTWKTLTLSGNIHNMLLPYNNKTRMALYLKNDKDLNISDKILSLNHFYSTGTLWANADNGMRLYKTDNSDSFFAKAVDYDNYLFIYSPNTKKNYSGIYFTKR